MTPHPPWRVIYDRIAPALALLCLVIAIGAGIGTYVNDRANQRQDRERLEQNEQLLACFDNFADDLAGALPPVREASQRRNETISETFAALENLLIRALAADGEEVPQDQAIQILSRLAKALEAYRNADQDLQDVQDENPYPEPPSEFCDLPD